MSHLEEAFAFQVRACDLPEPTREYRFHPVRKWRFDFAWPAEKIAVEVEGGEWVQGRHQRAGGFAADAQKYAEAMLLGWQVYRFPGSMITNGQAIEYTCRAFGLSTFR